MLAISKAAKFGVLSDGSLGAHSDCTFQEMRWRLGRVRIGPHVLLRAAFVALLVLLVSYWTLATCCGPKSNANGLGKAQTRLVSQG